MFHVFPIKTIFSKLTVPKTMRIKVLAKLKFCVQIWTFHALEIKIILVILPLTPLPMGVAKPEFCAFVDIKCNFQEIIFSELGSNFTCLRQIPLSFLGESIFNSISYCCREKSCFPTPFHQWEILFP